MYYEIKFHLKHYRASRSRYKSRKVRRISSKNARFRPFFLFVRSFLIRDGPFIYLFPLRFIRTYCLKCFGGFGSGHYGRVRVGMTPRGSNFGNFCTKIQVYYLFIRESDELGAGFSE